MAPRSKNAEGETRDDTPNVEFESNPKRMKFEAPIQVNIPKLKDSINWSIWEMRFMGILRYKRYANSVTGIIKKEFYNSVIEHLYCTIKDKPLLQIQFISDPNIALATLRRLYGQIGYSQSAIL